MRIAIVQLGRIGDLILTTPIFSAIKKQIPDADITVIASCSNYSILENNPNINQIIKFDKSPFALLKLLYKLKTSRYEVWIDAKDHRSSESKLLSKFVHADAKIGFNPRFDKYFHYPIPSDKENNQAGLHFTERAFAALKYLNIDKPVTVPLPELFISPEDAENAEKYFSKIAGKQSILINLSATNQTRIYSAENWIKVIESIDKYKYNIIISFMPAELDIYKQLIDKYPFLLASNTKTINELIALISNCDFVITPDTSAVHIAGAFNKPTIALYTDIANNFIKFRPISQNTKVIMPKGCMNVNEIQAQLIIDAIALW